VNDGKGEERLFKDIAEITVALPEPEAERLRCELNLYGYGITQEQNGFLLTGPDIRIRIESDKQDRYGVQSVIMKTKSYAGTSTHRIGTGCVLTLPGEGLAEWTLGTPG
jgi:hypothetical protein